MTEHGRAERLIEELLLEPNDQQYARLFDLLKEAEHLADKDSPRLAKIIETINATTPLQTDRIYFATLYGWSSANELARTWAAPLPQAVPDLTDDELLAILTAHAEHIGKPQAERLLHFLGESLGDAFSTGLIFWPYGEWTLTEMIAEIRYRRKLVDEGGRQALEHHETKAAEAILADINKPPYMRNWATNRLQHAT